MAFDSPATAALVTRAVRGGFRDGAATKVNHAILELTHDVPVTPGLREAYGPKTAVTFHASPEGAAFISAAADSWASAVVADGDEPGAARQAADRTVAFYAPPPDGATDGD